MRLVEVQIRCEGPAGFGQATMTFHGDIEEMPAEWDAFGKALVAMMDKHRAIVDAKRQAQADSSPSSS